VIVPELFSVEFDDVLLDAIGVEDAHATSEIAAITTVNKYTNLLLMFISCKFLHEYMSLNQTGGEDTVKKIWVF